MTEAQASIIFRPRLDQNPRSRQERYKRVHFYVSQLGVSASNQLKQALLALRNAAHLLQTEELQKAACKQYTEAEFMPAAKELLCIWIHLEAIDQGGEMMPAWLMNYLKLALYATDYIIESPPAMVVMDAHADCLDLHTLSEEVSLTIATLLGYGESAPLLAPAFTTLLTTSRSLRQRHLSNSLTCAIE